MAPVAAAHRAPMAKALALVRAVPAPPANRFAMRIAPAESFAVQGMLVERHGQGGRPLVLIPGLSSGPWAWQDLVRRFSSERAVYVVTLPGFDGRPAPTGPALDAFTSELTQDYPMNIRADSIEVTDTGIATQFSTRNASIPKQAEDPCFTGL